MSLCFEQNIIGEDFTSLTSHFIEKGTWRPKQIRVAFEHFSGRAHTGK
jgi:hypothetical protein